jgi:hypothetical protein
VEEFGIGLPTPGAVTFWISKGHLVLKTGQLLEIPTNFKLSVPWSVLVDREIKYTADQVGDRQTLRSLEVVIEERHRATPDPKSLEVYVDQNGNIAQPPISLRGCHSGRVEW